MGPSVELYDLFSLAKTMVPVSHSDRVYLYFCTKLKSDIRVLQELSLLLGCLILKGVQNLNGRDVLYIHTI